MSGDLAVRGTRPAGRARPTSRSALRGWLLTGVAAVDWRAAALEDGLRRFAEKSAVKLGAVAQPLRAALTGSLASPGIFEVMEVLGREESLGRIADAAVGGAKFI
jgi:glutamyl-tRNA synthetase